MNFLSKTTPLTGTAFIAKKIDGEAAPFINYLQGGAGVKALYSQT